MLDCTVLSILRCCLEIVQFYQLVDLIICAEKPLYLCLLSLFLLPLTVSMLFVPRYALRWVGEGHPDVVQGRLGCTRLVMDPQPQIVAKNGTFSVGSISQSIGICIVPPTNSGRRHLTM